MQHNFEKNAEKFYSSLGKAHEIHHLPIGSIHRPKPNYKNINFESDSYIHNATEFFDAYSHNSSNRQSRQLEKIDPEFRHASDRSSLASATEKKSLRSNGSQDYKFSSTRAEIAMPDAGQESLEKKNDYAGRPQRKSLSTVGKQYISR